MAYENSQAFSVESKKLTHTEQFENACRLEVQNEKPIRKVVCVKAVPKILSSEKVADTLEFAGRTSYQVVYETDENQLTSIFAVVEWHGKTECCADVNFLCPKVVENTITGFSSNEIAISSLLNIDIYKISSDKISSVTNLPDNYVIEEKTYECQKVVNSVNETFNEVFEQEINSKVSEVLYYNADVRQKSVTAGIDAITVEGTVFVDVAMIENGEITTVTKSIDFKQELSALSTIPNHIVDSLVRLNDIKVTASVSEMDQKTTLIYSVELGVFAVVYSKDNVSVIEDAFSVDKQTLESRECVETVSFIEQNTTRDTISGVFDSGREIDCICFVSKAEAMLSDIVKLENGTTINGCVSVELVCENEAREKIKVEGTIPFSSLVNQSVINNDQVSLFARINSVKLRGQGQIELVCELTINTNISKTEFVTFISSIEEVEEKDNEFSAITVYVVKEGETLFSIAKTLSIRPEEIVNQNPQIKDGLVYGTRLIVYTPLNIKF